MRSFAAVSLLALLLAAACPTDAAAAAPSVDLKVAKIVPDTAKFAGKFTIDKKFIKHGDGLAAVGTITGTVTDATGKATQVSVPNVVYPIADIKTTAAARKLLQSCDILNLVLGPLDLDLLGLQISLNQVVLDIVAQAGAGNLLGNLLCAVAGLLDGGLAGALDRILLLLNLILSGLLGGGLLG